MTQLAKNKEKMVESHLRRRGIRDKAVLEAMAEVPREKFIPDNMVHLAYNDSPLPIGEGQTISQPYIVALMIQAMELSAEDRVLDIGTGSGYAAAIISRIVKTVYSVERYRTLAETAKERFHRLGYENVQVLYGDGTQGWPEHAPYDAAVVAAGSPDIPQPLVDQLVIGGRLVIPVGSTRQFQELLRVRRVEESEVKEERLTSVRFVPLVGEAGWKEE